MKKLLSHKIFLGATMFFVSASLLSSCGQGKKTKTYDVTFYNGETVLKVEKVEEGKCATDWTPIVEGYTFQDWYGTPTFTHEYDFSTPITTNTSIFGKFITDEVVEDTRSFYIVGSGLSPLLLESNWGKVVNDSMKLTKAENANEYSITLDLYAGDQFQFAINSSWHNQRGVGYLQEFELDGEEVFKNPGSAYGNSSKRSNIEVKKDGNYTLTLTTYPQMDYYDTENANYTESGKENFNLSDYDKITWIRNGEVSEAVDAITTYYIKGAGITNWSDIYNNHTKLVDNEGVHSLKIFLKENEEFLFTSTLTVGNKVTTGTEYIRYSNLDESSKALFDANASYNLVAKANGYYTFAYNEENSSLSCQFEEGTLPSADYYIDGTFGEETAWGGYCFNESYKLIKDNETGIYSILNVSMKADSEFIIQAFKEGSTERGEWGSESYNGLGSYNFSYLVNPGELFTKVSDTNNNIKVTKEALYDITFDPYSQIITATEHVQIKTYDVYIKGGMNGWKFNFLDEWKLKNSPSNLNLYEITLAFEENWELGIVVYNVGETEGYGTWVGRENLGTSGDANDKFATSSGNLKCNTAGTYKVTYNAETKTIDFYQA